MAVPYNNTSDSGTIICNLLLLTLFKFTITELLLLISIIITKGGRFHSYSMGFFIIQMKATLKLDG